MNFAKWLQNEEQRPAGMMGNTPFPQGQTPSTSALNKNYNQQEKAAGKSGGPNVKTAQGGIPGNIPGAQPVK